MEMATVMAWVKTDGALLIVGCIGLILLWKVSKAAGDFFVEAGKALIVWLKRSDHEHAAANEQIAHIAEQLMQRQSGESTVVKRAGELMNGGPRATNDEMLLHLLKIGEDVGDIKLRLAEGDYTMKELRSDINEVKHDLSLIPNTSEQWTTLATEVAAIKVFCGIQDASAAGD